MSLVADYSSTSDEENSRGEDESDKSLEPKAKLPSANLLLSSGKAGEVFNNPYKEAEEAKIALLEKHVKMVDTEEHLKEKNGKKICWNYRKGRCRFGSNCTFAHDSDLQKKNQEYEISNNSNSQSIPRQSIICKPQLGLQFGTIKSSTPKNTNDETPKQRKRPGLGDSIVPSKKALKQYTAHKKKYP